MPSRTVWTSAVVLFVIGVVLHAVAVDQRTLWYDESATVIGAGRSFAQLGELVRHVDLVHAAYYALMHLWFDVVGSSAFTIRLPSAVAAAAAAALMVPLGARLVSVRVGVLSGAVLLVLPATAFGATNGRSGMCQVLAAVAASTVLVVVLDRVRDTTAGLGRIWLPSAAYVVVAALAIALQLWFVFVVVAHAVVAVLVLGARGRPPVARLAPVATAFVVLAVATLPFALAASHQSAQVSWLRAPDVTGVLTTLWRDESFSVGLVERSAVGASVTASVGWVLAAVGGARLFRRHREGFWSVALWWAVPPVGLLLVSAAGSPAFSARYLVFCVPAFALLMAVGIDTVLGDPLDRVPRAGAQAVPRPSWLGRVAVCALALVLVAGGAQAWVLVRWGTPTTQDWKTVAETISAGRRPADRSALVYGELGRTGFQLGVDYPEALRGVDDLTFGGSEQPSDALWPVARDPEEAVAAVGDHDVVWYVGSSGASLRGVTEELHERHFRGDDRTRFRGGIVIEFRRISSD
ncbi:hypothetical protein DEJ16_09770 [Curtobacterium sp. MCJR17_055]|nr:hypothetical protein DEJ16_09770 [Curtobacterium sp. MCJR17_055]